MNKTSSSAEELAIYNCHIHTFTRKNVPRYIAKLQLGPVFGVMASWLESIPPLFRLITRFLAWIVPGKNDVLERIVRFVGTGKLQNQKAIFEKIQRQYPPGTKFIILPMNMHHMGDLGSVREPIEIQHSDLLNLAQEVNDERASCGKDEIIFPFYTIHPEQKDIDNIPADLDKIISQGKFRGIKIYPNLGYYPQNDKLMKVYALCEKGNIPVMTHCNPGGVWKYGLTREVRRNFADPKNYKIVLDQYPDLVLCLAHFGGTEEWIKRLQGRPESSDKEEAWVKTIFDMIACGKYPNLYADISYTLFQPKVKGLSIDLVDYLKVMLSNGRIRARILFGSDYYMVEQEKISEKEMSILLRSRLGEDLYFQIAHYNPREYLGMERQKSKIKRPRRS